MCTCHDVAKMVELWTYYCPDVDIVYYLTILRVVTSSFLSCHLKKRRKKWETVVGRVIVDEVAVGGGER